MKQPKLKNLKYNKSETMKIREMASKTQKIKITINIEKASLEALKGMATKSGGSYQKILNEILKKGLKNKTDSESRLEKLEKEVEKIKRKLAA